MDGLYQVALAGAAIVVFAALVRLLKLTPQRKLRRAVLLFAPYAALTVGQWPLTRFHGETWFGVMQAAATLFGALLLTNLAALVIFDMFLRLLRVKLPEILHEVAIGAAYVVAVVWLMHKEGVNVTGIVATSAVVTAVVGLSLQSTLGNVIGGLALQIDDSLREGDWIELESKVQGRVKMLRWRHTVIETRDWDTLIVPNSQLINQTLKVLGKRAGAPLQHRMWVRFNVDFRFAPSVVIRAVNQALSDAPIEGVARDPKPHTVCLDFSHAENESYAHYAVRYWLTDLENDDPTSSQVRQRIYTALKREQIPLALPGAALFLEQDDAARREQKRLREQERVRAALRGVELFQRLSPEELSRLSAAVKFTPFVKDEIITRQHARAHWLYVLTKGEVSVRVEGEGGRERHVGEVTAPGFFGEMALMTGAEREATVVAKTDVECLRVDKDDFQDLLTRRPEIAHEVSSVLAERRVELETAREEAETGDRQSRIQSERTKILASIQDFFGMKG